MAGVVGFSSQEFGPVWIDQAAGAKGYVKPVASALDPSYKAPAQTSSPVAPSGGGGGDGRPYPNPSNDWMNEQNRIWSEQNQQSSGPSEADALAGKMRGEISSGYDAYFGELDAMLGELPNQRTAQEDIVGSQHTQGVADLGAEKATGLADLGMQRTRTESAQAKNLGGIGENIRNLFTSGQIKLGAAGAGDSSAVDQFSYALAKLGSKARGDVMSKTSDIVAEIDNREFKLNTIFSNEKTRLSSTRDQAISGIAQWFSEATNQIRGMVAQGQISKGQDLAGITSKLLDQAMQQAQTAQTAFLNRQGMLEQWALNNQEGIKEARGNISTQANYSPVLPQAGEIPGQINIAGEKKPGSYGGGLFDEEDRVTYNPSYQA